MRVNANFDEEVVLDTNELPWVTSPMAGVDRRMLDRVGEEVARATSLVRYAPGSHFSAHTHDGGEEFFVLSGVFSDEHGDFPAGSYIRNPPTSRHTPRSEEGCVILVKLHQFDPADRTHVRIDTNKLRAVPEADRPGVSVASLHNDAREDVRIERWGPDTDAEIRATNGIELFVLKGGVTRNGRAHDAGAWLRLPPGTNFKAKAGPGGADIWVKSEHLGEAAEEAAAFAQA